MQFACALREHEITELIIVNPEHNCSLGIGDREAR